MRAHTLFEQRAIRFVVIPLIGLVLLVGAYTGLRDWALRNADQLQVTVYANGPLIYQHTFGRTLAAFAEDMLNHDMTAVGADGPRQGSILTGNHATWSYHLTFLWHGLPVEATSADTDGLPEVYAISALGLTDLYLSVSGATSYSFIALLSAHSGGAIPLVPGYA